MVEGQRFGLYYPYLHFSDDWLKIAALYWPQMGRIVPESITLSDSDTVRALSDELGFVVRVPPESAVQELTDLLIDIVAEHGETLRERYSISKHYFMMSDSCGPSWPNPQRHRDLDEVEAAGRVVALHREKGGAFLWGMLADSGLAVQLGDWWGLHPQLAWLYMCALADKLATRNHLIPTTDQDMVHADSLTWTDELFTSKLLAGYPPKEIAATPTGRREQVGLLALSQVIPRDPHRVSVAKVVKVRRRYALEFDAFYGEVADLANHLEGELAGIADQDILARYLENEVRRRFRSPLDSLERAMRSEGVDTSITALTTKVVLPASTGALGGVLMHNPVVAAGGAVAFVAISLMQDLHRSRRSVTPSAASYLWRVDRELNPGNTLRKIIRNG